MQFSFSSFPFKAHPLFSQQPNSSVFYNILLLPFSSFFNFFAIFFLIHRCVSIQCVGANCLIAAATPLLPFLASSSLFLHGFHVPSHIPRLSPLPNLLLLLKIPSNLSTPILCPNLAFRPLNPLWLLQFVPASIPFVHSSSSSSTSVVSSLPSGLRTFFVPVSIGTLDLQPPVCLIKIRLSFLLVFFLSINL